MDSIHDQCRSRTESYFLRATNYYKKNTNKVLEQTEDYAKSIDREHLERKVGNIKIETNQYKKIKDCLNIIPSEQHDWMIKAVDTISQNNGIDYAIAVLEEEAEKHTKICP